MSNENKTALTAEEILANEILEAIKWMTRLRYDRKWSQEVAPLLVGYASLQTQEKDKEIAELKQGNKAKGIKIIEDAVKILQLQSQLSEVTKERDGLREGLKLAQTMILKERDKHLDEKGHSNFSTYDMIIIDNLLTPTKE